MGRADAVKRVKKENKKDDAMEVGDDLVLVKLTQPRGQPFDLELGLDFSIRLQMYVKNTEAKPDVTFVPIGASASSSATKQEDGEGHKDLRKIRRYETLADGAEVKVAFDDIDKVGDDQFHDDKKIAKSAKLPGGKEVAKDDVIKGYRYGSSLIPVSREEGELLEYPRKGKQLQLIQFTKKANILPQFILTNCRYMLPYSNDQTALSALSTLVEAMLENNIVALCRYAYNANSNPRVVCLIPKKTKNSYPVLMHYQLPFNEDIRSFEFPSLDEIGERPTDYQQDLIDSYIEHMDLSGQDGGKERVKCRYVKNPKFHQMSVIMKQRAKQPKGSLPQISKEELLAELDPPKDLLEKTRVLLEDIKEKFPLALNPYTRVAAFKAKKANACANGNGTVLDAKMEEGANGNPATKQEGGNVDTLKSEKLEWDDD